MNDPRQAARDLLEQNAITIKSLWIRYWSHRGNATLFEFEAYLYELQEPSASDSLSLALAMEDLEYTDNLEDLGTDV